MWHLNQPRNHHGEVEKGKEKEKAKEKEEEKEKKVDAERKRKRKVMKTLLCQMRYLLPRKTRRQLPV